ncbi:hypothetical protein [Jatrophihabitans lederbergiae]|uniref:Uncharacterized protein n=1 Tax=Jatrophihabitans lederbergiae TaxID=3075547 RepID=A0ABU2JFR7_9ACTN|nr:hypothetical protein [Jatrophihabitans sp. DSM 44399]MDT0263838.1 hypothetical protein [Jatrophihabitans sp. DSM 44399]
MLDGIAAQQPAEVERGEGADARPEQSGSRIFAAQLGHARHVDEHREQHRRHDEHCQAGEPIPEVGRITILSHAAWARRWVA